METITRQIDFVESDHSLLDAYSGTVTNVVRNSSKAVVHIKVLKKAQNSFEKGLKKQTLADLVLSLRNRS